MSGIIPTKQQEITREDKHLIESKSMSTLNIFQINEIKLASMLQAETLNLAFNMQQKINWREDCIIISNSSKILRLTYFKEVFDRGARLTLILEVVSLKCIVGPSGM